MADKLSGQLRMMHVNDNSGRADEHLPAGEGRNFLRDLSGSMALQRQQLSWRCTAGRPGG